ncbi:MAG: tetratricopeptide repeat protein [Candidatus Rokubacteria bacterium]|nr:tetratricopeptide repeat protein [Candidatus Rokubacteria bacterium]
MSRRVGRARVATAALVLVAALASGARAADPPLLPAPEIGSLLRPVSPALEKPPVPLPELPLPERPRPFPELPPPRIVSDPALRPTAALTSARLLACNPLGSFFGVASELVECGKARYQRGELEQAQAELSIAVQKGTDRPTLREARYWLAETRLRLKRGEAVEVYLSLVAQDEPRDAMGLFAAHSLAWVMLERGEAPRALPSFEGLLKGSVPPEIVPWARHGHALALYALGRYAEARDEWTTLLNRSVPAPLAAEVASWLGETLGRLGDARGAAARLQVFTAAGPQLLIETGLLRLGWWRRAAGQPLEAVKIYRGLLTAYPQMRERLWVRAGLVQALLDLDDGAAARAEASQLDAADRAGTLALPAALLVGRWAAQRQRPDEAQVVLQELLGRSLEPDARAWALVLSGETARRAGQPAEARERFEGARQLAAPPALAAHAGLRLAQMDLEGREFARASTQAGALLKQLLPPPLRAGALVVQGESAYWLRQYERAAETYRRLLADFSGDPLAPPALLALGWAEYRRGRLEAAGESWTRFAREAGAADARAPAALLLAAELRAQAGDEPGALQMLDGLLARFPESEHAAAAALNRAILGLRAGRAPDGLRELSEILARTPQSPYLGRMRLARGTALVAVGRLTEAQADFRAALAEGEDAARLGLGVVALERKQWNEATRELAAARDAGSGAVAGTAEYGLAAVAFGEGKKDDFKRLAAPLLAGPPSPATTPHLLQALAFLAGEEKMWGEARTLSGRLAREFPAHPATSAALAALVEAAVRDGQWPVAREAYQMLAARDPSHPVHQAGRLDFAEALLRTGAAPEARRWLEGFVALHGGDPRMARALLLLAEAHEAVGDRRAAVVTYARLRQEYPSAPGTEHVTLSQGRLLQAEGKWGEARLLLLKGLDDQDPAAAAEAAFRLGDGYRAAAQHQDAVEAYMTAAYLAPDSPWAWRALAGAGQSFAALKQRESAAIVYRKLQSASGVEPELAEAARRGLKALGVN